MPIPCFEHLESFVLFKLKHSSAGVTSGKCMLVWKLKVNVLGMWKERLLAAPGRAGKQLFWPSPPAKQGGSSILLHLLSFFRLGWQAYLLQRKIKPLCKFWQCKWVFWSEFEFLCYSWADNELKSFFIYLKTYPSWQNCFTDWALLWTLGFHYD